MHRIPLKPSSASKSGKIFRGAGGDLIHARGERSVTGRTEEGQSRRIVWEVCPVKRSLLSAPKIIKAGNQVYSINQAVLNVAEHRTSRGNKATAGCLRVPGKAPYRSPRTRTDRGPPSQTTFCASSAARGTNQGWASRVNGPSRPAKCHRRDPHCGKVLQSGYVAHLWVPTPSLPGARRSVQAAARS